MRPAAAARPGGGRRLDAAACLLLWAATATSSPAAAASSSKAPPLETSVKPGPAVISEAEKAIAPDPAGGAEHAVILLEETERNENEWMFTAVSHHVRAKILSNEGRDLANVEFPFNEKEEKLETWWGRTLLPDGTVQDLRREDLRKQVVVRVGGEERGVLKGALPGAAPGCVIDYGYVVKNETSRWLSRWWTVPLQRAWPIKELRYRWIPWHRLASGYVQTRTQGLAVEVTRYISQINVSGKGLPPAVDEPLMPSWDSVKAAVTFFYFEKDEDHADFWNSEAKKVEGRVRSFLGDGRAVRDAVAEMKLDAAADLESRLRAAYAWIGSNLRSAPPALVGGLETIRDKARDEGQVGAKKPRAAADVLQAREASAVQFDLLFVGAARALGAEANVVLAADRSEHTWKQTVLTMTQFDVSLVAVRLPGAPEGRTTFVDPGSGLAYGEIPWWAAGAKGLLVSDQGGREVALPAPEAARNVSETKASIEPDPADGSSAVRWSRTGSGQSGYLDRRLLRTETMDERRKRLDGLCGEGDSFEVSKAEAPGLDEVLGGLRIECEGERIEAVLDAEAPEASISFAGPWIEPLPELTSASRTHPVVFDFPRTERTTIEVAGPEGFAAGAPPRPVTLSGPFGAYNLSAAPSPDGFVVTRELTLLLPTVSPAGYRGLLKFLADVRAGDATGLRFARRDGAGSPGP